MKIDKILIKLIILALPFYFIRFSIGPIPTTLFEVLVYVVFLILLFGKKISWPKNSKIITPALIFVGAGLLGAFVDPNLADGLGLWKAFFFDGFLIFLMIVSSREEEDYAPILFYSGVLVSLLCLLIFYVSGGTTDGRILDLDRLSPNYLAMFLTPLLAIGMYEVYRKRTLANIIGSFVIAFALVLTQSRGALVGLAGALIGAIYFYLSKRKVSYKNWALLGMIVVFIVGGYLVFKPDWSDHARKSTSSNIRYYIWTTSLEVIGKSPVLGVGISNYQNYFSTMTSDRVNYPEFISPQALTAHNIYLQFLATTGLVGLIAFIYLLIKSKFIRKNGAIGLAIFALLAYGLVDTPFFRNDLAALFWILIAITNIRRDD